MKYSIQIVPNKNLLKELTDIVKQLSEKYHTPIFVPHMTIVGGFESDLKTIKQKLASIARTVTPLNLELGPISFSTTYFQSVFVRVNSTAGLMDLNLKIKKEFNLSNNAFMPHISLVYDIPDMKTREKISKEIELKNTKFTATELGVITDSFNPDEWKTVFSIPIGKQHLPN
jgi:2'-5' RNA ligase